MKRKKAKKYFLSMSEIAKKRNGFTFIEVMVAVFLFSSAMVMVMSVMVNTMIVKKRIQNSAQNLEEARFAMETMAKTLRGSKIISCDGLAEGCSSEVDSLETYDYSQGKCIQYSFASNQAYFRNGSGTSDSCSFSGVFIPLLNNNNKLEKANFDVVMSDDDSIGRVTIFMEICSKYNGDECVSGKSDAFPIQTTVSLRN